MTAPRNLLTDIPATLPQEQFETLLAGKRGFRVERIVSRGHASPPGYWYDQPQHEWVLLLSGQAELEYDAPAARQTLQPGDAVLIPAHRRHRVAATAADSDTVWLAIFHDAD
ncbi:cupin domain-containing protein [Vogesella sp. GCM10023246]|uniref:Cupin domain-containing protein n=1 Tax=Vogesella oryzagri TaxID=3160864 RepID=A0ABV1MBX6_9NEIS